MTVARPPEHGRKRWQQVLAAIRAKRHHGCEMSPLNSPREVVIVAYAGVQSLDVAGPLEVFSGAAQLVAASGRADPGYLSLIHI